MGEFARTYPARTDATGRTWYRSGGSSQDGWTTDIELAHPDYRAPDAPDPIPVQQEADHDD